MTVKKSSEPHRLYVNLQINLSLSQFSLFYHFEIQFALQIDGKN